MAVKEGDFWYTAYRGTAELSCVLQCRVCTQWTCTYMINILKLRNYVPLPRPLRACALGVGLHSKVYIARVLQSDAYTCTQDRVFMPFRAVAPVQRSTRLKYPGETYSGVLQLYAMVLRRDLLERQRCVDGGRPLLLAPPQALAQGKGQTWHAARGQGQQWSHLQAARTRRWRR